MNLVYAIADLVARIGSRSDSEAATGDGSLTALLKSHRTHLDRLRRGGTDFPQAARRSGALEVGASEVVLNASQSIIIDHLSMGSNSRFAVLSISVYPETGGANALPTASAGGTTTAVNPSIESISRGEAGALEVTRWDPPAQRFAVRLRHPLVCPRGAVVSVRNLTDEPMNVACAVIYRVQ